MAGLCRGAGGAGLASLLLSGRTPYLQARLWDRWHGRPLRDLAALCRSWEPQEAAIGTAALTAWHTGRHPVPAARETDAPPGVGTCSSCCGSAAGAKPCLWWGISGALSACGRRPDGSSSLSGSPGEGDYPDTAEEFLLPGSDVVILTGMTLTNKTLPRLLELARGAFVAVTGPSVPWRPVLFSFGADACSV